MIYKGYKIIKNSKDVEVKELKNNPKNRNKWKHCFYATDVEVAKKAIDITISNKQKQDDLVKKFKSDANNYYDLLFNKLNKLPDENGQLYNWGKGISTAMFLKGALNYLDYDLNNKMYSHDDVIKIIKKVTDKMISEIYNFDRRGNCNFGTAMFISNISWNDEKIKNFINEQ